jgi:hypothetical protein
LRNISTNPKNAEKQKQRIWGIVKQYLANNIPVIVHQYWRGKGSTRHYRVVTGYDNLTKPVYLNYSKPGIKLSQTYREFFSLWDVDEQWLHYNAIVCNASGNTVNLNPNLNLSKYPYRFFFL